MTTDTGIVDNKKNPFACNSWIDQRFSFTPKRQSQMIELFCEDYNNVLAEKNNNEGSYVAFVAIRWGFAELINGILTPTEIWENRDLYDGFGKPKRD